MSVEKKSNNVGRDNVDKNSIELAYASLAIYADDGTIDEGDLTTLLHVATRDGKISDREKEILRALFNRIQEEDVSGEVWDHIQRTRKQHAI
jgi:hypothetical protein